jgi:hypothetical protein
MILFCQETTAVHVPLVIIQIKAFTDGETKAVSFDGNHL